MTALEPYAVLTTKLHRPPPARNLVQRARLVERLDLSLSGSLTLISAAAGFGKSTLVSSWVEGLGTAGPPAVPVAWLSLDEDDGDLIIFLRYAVAALRTIFPEACVETAALLRAPPLSQDYLVTTFTNELALLPQRCVLVLDDYSTLRGEAVPELLTAMVRHWPQPLHMVIIVRHDPPLPLPSLRAKGMITEIRSRELRFTAEETAAYVSKALPAPLDPPAMALLEQRTEGWIAGLHLACLSLRDVNDADAILATLANDDAQIADYLIDEVLSQQPAAIQSFLLRTSVLDRFCASLCAAVVVDVDPAWPVQACMDRLEHNNLFVIPLDNRRKWYRYHHEFQDLLRQRLNAELGTSQVADLHRRAAAWHAGRGLAEEALHHGLAAGDLDLVADLMEEGVCQVLNREDWPTLNRWLSLLPEEFIQHHPGLLMIKAWALQFSWQLGAQAKVLDRVEALLVQDGGAAWPAERLRIWHAQRLVLRGQAAHHHNQATQAVACCQEALALLPRTWTYCRGGAMLYLGMGMQASGRGQSAEHLLLDDYVTHDNKTDGYALRLLLALCFNYLHAGQLEQVRQTAQLMAQQARQGRLTIALHWADYFLGLVRYYRNELEAAQSHLRAVVDNRYHAQTITLRASLMGLALTYQAGGKGPEAHEQADLLGQNDVEQRGIQGDSTRALRARLLLMQGDVMGAARWADAYAKPPVDQPLLWLEEPNLTQARILIARGGAVDVRWALRILDALYAIAERTFNARAQIEILALYALAYDAQGRVVDAMAALEQVVDLAQPGDFIRVFVEPGLRMRSLLDKLAQHSGAEPIAAILAALPDPPMQGEGSRLRPTRRYFHPALIEGLTPRELEILMLLREPLSPKEIARKLDVSHATVKRHTSNLYGKLGVNTRWDAVAVAERLEILAAR